ncbi:MAG: phosphatidylcholine/phosphatidylserine synthase [Planctomycetes bacterium]|nr:phosphatidylcholine/phosphatidylserine synthase [Planctomycetota bacterium]
MKLKPKLKKLTSVPILPTLLTLGNLLCGFGVIIYAAKGALEIAASKGSLEIAAWLIFVAMVFDALDGRVARATKTASHFGEQMDSLADVITFGLAPVFLTNVLLNSKSIHYVIPFRFIIVLEAFYLVCATLRLARFTIETALDRKSHEYFSGLPTPGAAGFLASLVILYVHLDEIYKIKEAETMLLVLPFVILLLSVLMISRFQYVHLLNKLSRNHPFTTLVEVVLFALLVAFQLEITISAVLLIYVLSGPYSHIKSRLFHKIAPDNQPESWRAEDKHVSTN